LLSGLWALFFFSLSGSKLPTYILPAFPMLSLVFGCFLANTPLPKRRGFQVGLACQAAVLLLGFLVVLPYYAQQRSPLRDRELISRLCADPTVPIICFPRNCDSVAFYTGRKDLQSLRGKQANDLLIKVLEVPTSVVLFTHDHSLSVFQLIMPDDIYLKEAVSLRKPKNQQTLFDRAIGANPWGLCDVAVVQHKKWYNPSTHRIESTQVSLKDAEDHDDYENGH
jgi:hypothetical protein